jgi:cysteine desulfuration protein SufE
MMVEAPEARIETIADEFAFLDGWEERYRHVIDLGKALPDLEASARTDENKVRGCASQVWLVAGFDGDGEVARLHLRGDSDAHIVRGLVALLVRLYDGLTRAEARAVDARAAFARFGFADALSPQRSNGLNSMIARIRALIEA